MVWFALRRIFGRALSEVGYLPINLFIDLSYNLCVLAIKETSERLHTSATNLFLAAQHQRLTVATGTVAASP